MGKKIKITIQCGCDGKKLENGDGCKLINGEGRKIKQG